MEDGKSDSIDHTTDIRQPVALESVEIATNGSAVAVEFWTEDTVEKSSPEQLQEQPKAISPHLSVDSQGNDPTTTAPGVTRLKTTVVGKSDGSIPQQLPLISFTDQLKVALNRSRTPLQRSFEGIPSGPSGSKLPGASDLQASKKATSLPSVNDGDLKKPAALSKPKAPQSPESILYSLKDVTFNSTRVKIVMQNSNGPCPLIGIFNVLLLRNQIKINERIEHITNQDLLIMLTEFIMDEQVAKFTDDANLGYTIDSILKIIPTLVNGMDVNVYFKDCESFEFTENSAIFDICNIKVVHGWVVSPNDWRFQLIAENLKSYNAVVEVIIKGDIAEDQVFKNPESVDTTKDELITKARVLKEFFNESATQITRAGLVGLRSSLIENQPCLLFRNNHFSTIVKHKNTLFTLVTDQGYIDEDEIVWESLTDISGDSNFFNYRFAALQKSSTVQLKTFEADLVAKMKLGKEMNLELTDAADASEAFARQLQQDELQKYENYMYASAPSTPDSSHKSTQKKKECLLQ